MKPNLIKANLMFTLLVCGCIILLAGWAARLYAQEKPKTDADIVALLDKIGRASCRERVCLGV